MRLPTLAILALSAALTGCAGTSALTATQTSLTDAQTVLTAANTALNSYGIAKGIAEVAEVADPALAPILGNAIATADPLVSQLQAAVSAAQIDTAAVQALVAQISAQATTITTTAAPVIKVVPAVAAAAGS
jgi:hypothetical protein